MSDRPEPSTHRIFVGSVGRLLHEAAGAFAADRLALAEQILRQVIELRPREHAAWRLRGLNAAKGNQHEAALRFLGRAIALAPDNPRYRADLGVILARLGQHELACAEFERAGTEYLAPGQLFHYANALVACGRLEPAIDAYRAASAQRPKDADILNNLALALMASGRTDEAEAGFRQALDRRPAHPDALLNLGNLYRMRGDADAAMACYRDALRERPDDFRLYGNLGLALLDRDRAEDAVAVYEKALRHAPDQPDIRKSLGIAQLLLGNFSEGWANYEARWQAEGMVDPGPALPRWNGEALAGRNILLQCEQGFGDSLQFCRYVPLVADIAGTVTLEVPRSLARLMHSLEGRVQLVVRGEALPEAACRAGLLSLPLLTGAGAGSLDDIPVQIPYLHPPAPLAQIWAARLSGGSGRRIGLAWAGNPKRQDDWMRSCPATAAASLLEIQGIDWVSLQKDLPDDAGESRRLAARMVDPTGDFADFADTAAAIQTLDLVVTVDTAVAHLAGALGKPVWTMLSYAADWRYLRQRDDCPWYPTMRLYRQPRPGDWATVIDRIAADLRQRAP
ncbi:MAG: tetratricopeptide repeat protein [Alphaproteobacteria bacterium]